MTISQISFRQNKNTVLDKSQNKKNDFSLKTPLEPICAPIYIKHHWNLYVHQYILHL